MSKKSERLSQAKELFSNPPTSPVEQSEVSKYLKDVLRLSRADIGAILGISERQVKTRLCEWKNYVLKGLIPTGKLELPEWKEEPLEEVREDESETRIRSLITSLTKRTLSTELFEESLVKKLEKIVPSSHDFSKIEQFYEEERRLRVRTISQKEEVAVATMSDAHFGLVNPYYNLEIAKACNNRFLNRIVRLTDLHRSQCIVKHLFYNVIGDNIQNSQANFPSQRWTTNLCSADQMEVLIGILVENVETLLIEFDTITVNCMPGNHGYVASKKTSTEPLQDNYEFMAHRALQWAFRDNKRITFNITTEWYQIVDIGGRKTFLTHGHDLSGFGLDSIKNGFRRLQDILPYFDDVCAGHYHHLERLSLPRVFGSTKQRTIYLNGSPVQGDSFSDQKGSGHTTEWWMYFAGSGKVSAEYPIPLYGEV